MTSKIFMIASLVGLITHSAFSQSLSTSWTDPSTTGNELSLGVVSFLLPSNISLSDDSYSLATALIVDDISHYVVASNFGFSIPANATIDGIEVQIEKSGVLGTYAITDNSVRLFVGGAAAGSNYKKTGSWPVSDTYFNYGGPADRWGVGLTPAIVNAANFGIGLSARLGGLGLPVAKVDHIQMKIHYTVPLPVGFGQVLATSNGTSCQVNWSTLTEFNNSHFQVEQSLDGKTWTNLGKVQGAGTSVEKKNYIFRDVLNGSGYYRIKQVDFDGAFSYSPTVFALQSLKSESSENMMVRYFSATSTVRIEINSEINELQLTNSLGEILKFESTKLKPNVWDVQLAENSSPIVYVKVKDFGGNISSKTIFLIKD